LTCLIHSPVLSIPPSRILSPQLLEQSFERGPLIFSWAT
jgi:hypothetical protein